MPCSFFVPEPACRCAAITGAVIPSIYERERFCRSEQGFMRCPTYRAQMARGGRLAERDYYALWLDAGADRTSETADAVSTGLGQT